MNYIIILLFFFFFHRYSGGPFIAPVSGLAISTNDTPANASRARRFGRAKMFGRTRKERKKWGGEKNSDDDERTVDGGKKKRKKDIIKSYPVCRYLFGFLIFFHSDNAFHRDARDNNRRRWTGEVFFFLSSPLLPSRDPLAFICLPRLRRRRRVSQTINYCSKANASGNIIIISRTGVLLNDMRFFFSPSENHRVIVTPR